MDSEFLRVTIAFDQSHLFFPRIVTWVLIGLFLIAAVVRGPGLVRRLSTCRADVACAMGGVDLKRFFGTILLVVVYVVAMDGISLLFPNQGLSFLFCSIAFMAALSFLYVHDLTRMKVAVIALSSVLAPLIAWYVLAKLFFLTLP